VVPRSEDPKLIIRIISFELTKHNYGTQRHGPTDGQTVGRLMIAIRASRSKNAVDISKQNRRQTNTMLYRWTYLVFSYKPDTSHTVISTEFSWILRTVTPTLGTADVLSCPCGFLRQFTTVVFPLLSNPSTSTVALFVRPIAAPIKAMLYSRHPVIHLHRLRWCVSHSLSRSKTWRHKQLTNINRLQWHTQRAVCGSNQSPASSFFRRPAMGYKIRPRQRGAGL